MLRSTACDAITIQLAAFVADFASMGESQEAFSLHGRVRGINGEPIPSAVIDVRSISGNALERILTDANGSFHYKSADPDMCS